MDDHPEHRDQLLTELTDEIFRINGQLLSEGDALTSAVGLTAAQWQVLGRLADTPMSASALAHRRGLRRQSVQETIDRLMRLGLLEKLPNPLDLRAPLLTPTSKGLEALERIEPLRKAWAASRSRGIPEHDLIVTLRTLRHLRAIGQTG